MLDSNAKKVFMQAAIQEAKRAQALAEVPIGAIIIDSDQKIIGRGYNRREIDQDAVMHAEIIAIQEACRAKNSWRLEGCQLFVTLEPCPMCTGAIMNSRLAAVYYGAPDPKAGALGSVLNLYDFKQFNHHPKVFAGLYQKDCAQLLKDFFRAIRQKK